MYDFFFDACSPCKKLNSYLLQWLPHVDTSKLMVIGINPFDDEATMLQGIEQKKYPYPVIIGKQAEEINNQYRVSSYPTLFLVGPNGIIELIDHGASRLFLQKVERIASKQ